VTLGRFSPSSPSPVCEIQLSIAFVSTVGGVALPSWHLPRGRDSHPGSAGGLGSTSWILQGVFSVEKKADFGHCHGSGRVVAGASRAWQDVKGQLGSGVWQADHFVPKGNVPK